MESKSRSDQLRSWVKASPPEQALNYDGVVMWGVCFNLDDESIPPVALFSTKEEANAYGTLARHHECDISPYVLSIQGRNDFEVPKEGS